MVGNEMETDVPLMLMLGGGATVTVKLRLALNGGRPLSVPTTVIVVPDEACIGVQVKSPPGEIAALPGAPACRLNETLWPGSASLAVAWKLTVWPRDTNR